MGYIPCNDSFLSHLSSAPDATVLLFCLAFPDHHIPPPERGEKNTRRLLVYYNLAAASSARPSSSTPLSPTVWFDFINKYPAYWRQCRPWEIILLPLSLPCMGNRGDREEEQKQQRLGRWSLNILLIAFLPFQLCPSCEENRDYRYQCALLAWDNQVSKRTIKDPEFLLLVIYFSVRGDNREKSVLEAGGVHTIGFGALTWSLRKVCPKCCHLGEMKELERRQKTVLPLE